MSTTTEEIVLESSKQSLPLSSYKKMPIKTYVLIAAVAVIGGYNYFFMGDKKAQEKKQERAETYELNTINPITQSSTNVSSAPAVNAKDEKLKAAIEELKAKDFIERLQASQTVQNSGSNSNEGAHQAVAASSYPAQSSSGMVASSDPNTAFLENESAKQPERVFALKMPPLSSMIAQGKFIFGSLSVAINSDLPGQVSAIVSQDVYAEQGRIILIPRGSRLVGEYRSGLANNQSRVFIVWTRVILPNGTSVLIGSEGTDALGRAGLTGDINNHFFARFGTATLISLIGAGASNVGVNPNDEYNSMAAYRQAVAQAMSQQANNTLSQTANIPPTIEVHQGERIVIFVNKDLDFSRVLR